jgi:hypothetical protein
MKSFLQLFASPEFEGARAPIAKSRWQTRHRALLVFTLAFLAALGARSAQEDRKHKVPVLDKINSGPSEQAFNGTVQSLDVRHSLLNVNTVQGSDTEIFPIKKSVHVSTATGGKLKLAALTPGTNVLIYYEQKGDRRTVKNIVVLRETPPKKEKQSPPPS